MDYYEFSNRRLVNLGFDLSAVEELGRQVAETEDCDVALSLIDEISRLTTKTHAADRNFGALLMQRSASRAKSRIVAEMLLEKAIEIAKDFSYWASAPGEGIARYQHVTELEAELNQLRGTEGSGGNAEL